MGIQISGVFEVKIIPLTLENPGESLGRMGLDKQYHGALDASGKGEMLSAMTGVKGSAGYVAIEKVSGKLQGKTGSFVLQHSGSMSRGAKNLSVSVVPDSGTEELLGLTGRMDIRIENGEHFYDFDFSLPAAI